MQACGRNRLMTIRDPSTAPWNRSPQHETLGQARRPAQFGDRAGYRLCRPPLHQSQAAPGNRTIGDHPRRGGAGLRRGRQRLHRGSRRAVVHLARVQRGAAGRGRRPRAAPAAILSQLRRQGGGADHRPLREADRPVAGADVEGVFRQFGFRSKRFRDQADLVLQQRPGTAGEEEDHLAGARVPRGDRRLGQPHRPLAQPPGLRSAAGPVSPRRLPPSLPVRRKGRERRGLRHPPGREPGKADPRRGSGHGRGDVRRTGDGRRRGHRAAGDVFRQDPAGAQAP